MLLAYVNDVLLANSELLADVAAVCRNSAVNHGVSLTR